MSEKEKDFSKRLKQTLKADEKGTKGEKSSEQAMEDMLRKSGLSKNVDQSRESAEEAASYMAKHTVAAGETLSHIAQQYYGSAVREDWMAIYEENKETIGDNPSLIRPGQELNIPKR